MTTSHVALRAATQQTGIIHSRRTPLSENQRKSVDFDPRFVPTTRTRRNVSWIFPVDFCWCTTTLNRSLGNGFATATHSANDAAVSVGMSSALLSSQPSMRL